MIAIQMPCLDVLDLNFHTLHTLFWGVSESPLFVTHKTKMPNLRTLKIDKEELEFTIISLPDGVKFPHGQSKLLITSIFETFWDLVSADDKDWQELVDAENPHSHPSHATVITGQPGIGEFLVFFFRIQCLP
jgi:hypothetical protein